jgi:hypothetical protein
MALMVIDIGGVASAKRPSSPPGPSKQSWTTVQLEKIAPGITSPTGYYRWLDVADQAYAASYRSSYDYTQASVNVSYQVLGGDLQGKLVARNLKPNFAYQVKLVGDPDLDPDANENIGFAGRWWQEICDPSGCYSGRNLNTKCDSNPCPAYPEYNPNDIVYLATRDDPNYRYTGYMVFAYFVTDGSGKATLQFRVDSSYHVLFKDYPVNQRTWTPEDGPIETASFDPSTSSKAYDFDYGLSTVGVFGEWEHLYVGAIHLRAGIYTCQIVLTEESFHGSGGTYAGNWAAAMGGTISFEIP